MIERQTLNRERVGGTLQSAHMGTHMYSNYTLWGLLSGMKTLNRDEFIQGITNMHIVATNINRKPTPPADRIWSM